MREPMVRLAVKLARLGDQVRLDLVLARLNDREMQAFINKVV